MNRPFELLLLASRQDIPYLARQINVLNAFHRPDRTRVVLSSSHFGRPEIQTLLEAGCEIVDEDRVVPGLTLKLVSDYVKDIPGASQRGGWYFKQFLLIAYAMTESTYPYYLAWDADTTPLRHIPFFDKQGRTLYARKTEYHKPYFKTIEKLTGLRKEVDFSFIAEHMMFDKNIGQELVEVIMRGVPFDGKTFALRILDAIDWKDAPYAAFSEYETYGTFANAKHRDLVDYRNLPSSRKGGEYFTRAVGVAGLFGLSRRFAWCTFELYPIKNRWHLVKRFIRRSLGILWMVKAILLHPLAFRRFRAVVGKLQ